MRLIMLIMAATAVFVSGCATSQPPVEQTAAARSQDMSHDESIRVQLKVLTVDEFMPNRLNVRVNVPVVVPADYELADLQQASPFEAHWMKPEDVAIVNRTQDLPAGNGYMEGRIALAVGYDRRRDVFIGADDPDTLKKMGTMLKGISAVKMERYSYGRFPVLLLMMKQEGSGKLLYAMYIGLNVDTQVAHVAFRPANNSQVVGEYVWGELKKKLRRVPNIPVRTFP